MKRFCAILFAILAAVPALPCTTAVVSAGASYSGRPMLWKQRDAGDQANIMVRVTGRGYAYTGIFAVSDTLRAKCYGGLNEAGFAIINNLSYNLRPDSLGLDTRNGELMARALSECATVEDFLLLLDSIPAPRELSANFGVADSRGGAAYFEAGDSTFVRYDVPADDLLWRTNYSLSGDPSRGRGQQRYATMDVLTEPPGLFSPSFFLNAGRTYIRDGRDVLPGATHLTETGFIPRSTTVSGIVIECPVAEGEKGLIWCATGYTPCCYAIPVWEGAPMPLAVQGSANELAIELYKKVHPGGDKELDVKVLRKILRKVQRAEQRELRLGRRLDARMHRSGYDEAAVRAYNDGADRRLQEFKKSLKL